MIYIIINRHNLTREKKYIPKTKKDPCLQKQTGISGHEGVRIQLTTDHNTSGSDH